ncbi:MAG: class I SAM-dependent methyltransferase [Anaerolineales bacterium]|nr:class I SAM-dependent methyltransferase [Anaerolineales bacterium]
MSILVEVCPLCGGRNQTPFESGEDAGQQLHYRLCETCGLVFQSPRMSEEELAAFYASGYRQTVQGSEAPTDKDLRIQAGRARHLVEFCRGRLGPITRHLDIGSSSGALLRAFAGAYRCQSAGIEPGEAYRAASLAQGMQVAPRLEDLPPTAGKAFDLVSIIHALEHIPDPASYLARLRETWMAPSGALLVETPNLFGHRAIELAHLVAYSPRTLRQTLEAAGFRVLKTKTHGAPRSPVLRLYLTVLAQALPPGQPVRRSRFRAAGVVWRRRWGLWMLETLTEKLPNWTWREFPQPEGSAQ